MRHRASVGGDGVQERLEARRGGLARIQVQMPQGQRYQGRVLEPRRRQDRLRHRPEGTGAKVARRELDEGYGSGGREVFLRVVVMVMVMVMVIVVVVVICIISSSSFSSSSFSSFSCHHRGRGRRWIVAGSFLQQGSHEILGFIPHGGYTILHLRGMVVRDGSIVRVSGDERAVHDHLRDGVEAVIANRVGR